jgi:hypothetical protein
MVVAVVLGFLVVKQTDLRQVLKQRRIEAGEFAPPPPPAPSLAAELAPAPSST